MSRFDARNASLVGIVLLIPAACWGQGYNISTVAGSGPAAVSVPGDGGQATSTTLGNPTGITLDSAGNFYFADTYGIRKVTPQGIISTVAGSYPYAGYYGDGGAATDAEIDNPQEITFDTVGNLYIADSGNNRIRKISTTGIITTVAGNGSTTKALGDQGLAVSATLIGPWGVAVDAAGNLYIADTGNNRIRKVSNGIITTIAGTGAASDPTGKGAIGDGGLATSAIVGTPRAIRLDPSGNILFVDGGTNRIRKITTGGTISTVVGNGLCCGPGSFSGDGGPAISASLNSPDDVAIDAAGNLYIADNANLRVRMVNTSGMITTIAGDGSEGDTGNGSSAIAAGIGTPNGVAVRGDGSVFVTELQVTFGLVRLLTPTGAVTGLPPSIRTSNGVASASAFGAFPSAAPGSWIEIYGSNLAVDSRQWTGNDFSGVSAPTLLDGTGVTVGGQSAYVDYISSTQVNAQVPSGIGAGQQPVVVTTPSGSSAAYTINVNAAQPGLLAPLLFDIAGTQYVVAQFSDNTYVLPPGSIPGVASQRAQPGQTITIYGVGFGAVTPSIGAGQIEQQSNTLAAPFQMKFGTTPAVVTYDGLAPDTVGSYQFNVVVPSIPSSDAVPLTFTLGGVPGTQTLYIAVQNGNTAVQVQSLTLSPTSVPGGASSTGTVTLTAAASGNGAVVALSSSSAAVTVPATVTVPAGMTSAAFTFSTSNVSSNQTVAITATYGGGSAQAQLTVTGGGAPPQVQSVALSAPSVAGGGSVTGTVTLTGAAPSGGALVTLTSSSTSATVPATVTIAAGSTSAAFTVSTSAVSSNQTATITAHYGGGSAQATLTVTSAAGGGTLPPFSFISGLALFGGFSISNELVDQALISASGVLANELLTCDAFFTGYNVSGTTYTPAGLDLNKSTCTEYLSAGQSVVAGVTAATATITLSPVVPNGTSGNASWTVSIVSSFGTISQSFTGTYTATLQ